MSQLGLLARRENPAQSVHANFDSVRIHCDAKNWDAKELLQNLRDGVEEGNKRRESMGIAPIVVSRWVEPPAYESAAHRLVWSAEVKLKNSDDPDPAINYNTYVLGRGDTFRWI